MNRPFIEQLRVTVASPGGSADSDKISGSGFLTYIEVVHEAVGDPDFKLQIINLRGTVVWETTILTGDSLVFVAGKIPTANHRLRIKDSTLAGLFQLDAHYTT